MAGKRKSVLECVLQSLAFIKQSGRKCVENRSVPSEPAWMKVGEWWCLDKMGVAHSQIRAMVEWMEKYCMRWAELQNSDRIAYIAGTNFHQIQMALSEFLNVPIPSIKRGRVQSTMELFFHDK